MIVEQHKFYKQDIPITYQLLLTISSQILGYAFAGLTRRYLVRPASMIWPATLMSTAMFTTLHKSSNKRADGWEISRFRFFVYAWAAAFLWYFIPGLLMPALSTFSVLTWFDPNNVVLANLFGIRSGLGLLPVTFDWAYIAFIGSPLTTPWWAAANVLAGVAIVMWVVAPIMYYSNALYTAYMPIMSSAVFDNTGQQYNVSKILTESFHFDPEAYLKYSPIYLPVTYLLSYTVQFASLTALVTHTYCWHGKDIWEQTKESFRRYRTDERKAEYQPVHLTPQSEDSLATSIASRVVNHDMSEPDAPMDQTDVHNRLMAQYEDAPVTWYLFLFLSMLAIAVFLVE